MVQKFIRAAFSIMRQACELCDYEILSISELHGLISTPLNLEKKRYDFENIP